jgi:MerR family transcriptional regulator, copper efflux regulator
MLIAELARATGFTTDTIRHYEKLGIIARPIRRENGYRDYPPSTAACLRLCKKAKALGFSLREIRELGKLLDARRLSRTTVESRLRTKLSEIDQRIVALQRLRVEIAETLRSPAVFWGEGRSEVRSPP